MRVTPAGRARPAFASVDHWDHPRSVTGARLIVDFAVEHGAPVDGCVVGTGIVDDVLNDPAAVIEAQQEIEVVRNVLRIIGDRPGMGVEVGARYHLTAFGFFGFALLSSATMAAAAQLAEDYFSLSFAFTSMVVEVDEDRWVLGFTDDRVPDDVRRFFTERDMAAALTMYREMNAPAFGGFRAARFAFPAVAAHSYPDHFGASTAFDCPRSELVFDGASIDAYLPQANAHTVRECLVLCDRIKSRRLQGAGFAAQVRAGVEQSDGVGHGLDAAARTLHVAARTLRRRLADEGTSYSAIVDEVRRLTALRMIREQRVPPSVAAERLGYGDVSSFLRALRRWQRAEHTTG